MDIAIPRPSHAGHVIPEVHIDNADKLSVRSATVQDVNGMSALINEFASAKLMLPRGPQYMYEHIRDYVVITAPEALRGQEAVIACGSSHVLWEDFAEIRSVAVHPSCQGKGLGGKLVGELANRSGELGIHRVFVFTLAVQFFTNCGFTEIKREDLPSITWVECSKCPKFYKCDEISMIRSV